MSEREWVVQLDDSQAVSQLRIALNISERHDRGAAAGTDTLQLLVDRFAGLRVEVFAREHPLLHFRVSGNGDSGNYRISDCQRLNGGLRRHYRVIRDWHARNRH